jgi:hypothetical protein
MIHSSRRDRKSKAIAEALAMIADAHPELDPHRPRPVRETDEWLDRYAGRTIEIKSAFAPAARRPRVQGGTHPNLKTGLDLRAGPAAPAHALNPAQQAARPASPQASAPPRRQVRASTFHPHLAHIVPLSERYTF